MGLRPQGPDQELRDQLVRKIHQAVLDQRDLSAHWVQWVLRAIREAPDRQALLVLRDQLAGTLTPQFSKPSGSSSSSYVEMLRH